MFIFQNKYFEMTLWLKLSLSRTHAGYWTQLLAIRFFHRSHNTVHFGGVFALKQWIISSLKHDTVPRVNNLYCFYVKNPPKRVALWDRENSQLPRFSKHEIRRTVDAFG